MANPLYRQMQPQMPNNLLRKYNQFRNSFKGDPRQKIQQMMNSGQVSQEQYDRAVQMAQQFQRMFKM